MTGDTDLTLDLFAGPGGWDEGARLIGLPGRIIGLEYDDAACKTAEIAGHERYKADLSLVAVDKFGPFQGLIASPPCQAYSTAGKGLGKLDKPRILAHVQRIREAGRWLHYSRDGWHDNRSPLVLEPLRFALEGMPEWIACEQVPAVLPLWEAFADVLRDHGYSVATGKLSAERYGVPQTRKRAILIAKLRHALVYMGEAWESENQQKLAEWSAIPAVSLPAPTHQPYSKAKPYDPSSPLPRWVSMAEALGWETDGGIGYRLHRGAGMTERYGERPDTSIDRPAPVITSKARTATWSYRNGTMKNAAVRHETEPAPTVLFGHNRHNVSWHMNAAGQTGLAPRELDDPSATITCKGTAAWVHDRPATTIACDARVFQPGGHHTPGSQSQNAIRVSVQEASVLQSFRPDYPWQGSRTKQYEQVGNAVPPLLAAAVLGELNGLAWHDVAMSMRPTIESEAAA